MKARRTAPSAVALEQATVRYVARKDRTESQVQVFLQHRNASPSQIQAVIRRMRRLGYLNDVTYAPRWAEERISKRPMGRRRLEAEMLAQGFPPALVDQTLTEIYVQRGERAWAEALLRVKRRQAAGLGRQAQLLRSHGFSEEIIEEVLRC